MKYQVGDLLGRYGTNYYVLLMRIEDKKYVGFNLNLGCEVKESYQNIDKDDKVYRIA